MACPPHHRSTIAILYCAKIVQYRLASLKRCHPTTRLTAIRSSSQDSPCRSPSFTPAPRSVSTHRWSAWKCIYRRSAGAIHRRSAGSGGQGKQGPGAWRHSEQPASNSPAGASPSIWRRPIYPRKAAVSTCRSRWVSWPPPARSAANGWGSYECLGELALGGELRGVRGVLPAALACRDAKRTLLAPADQCRRGIAGRRR
jgi:hypothetical protein